LNNTCVRARRDHVQTRSSTPVSSDMSTRPSSRQRRRMSPHLSRDSQSCPSTPRSVQSAASGGTFSARIPRLSRTLSCHPSRISPVLMEGETRTSESPSLGALQTLPDVESSKASDRGAVVGSWQDHATALSVTVSASGDLSPVQDQSACFPQVRSCAALSGGSPVSRCDFVAQHNLDSVADLHSFFSADRCSVNAQEASCRGTDHATFQPLGVQCNEGSEENACERNVFEMSAQSASRS